MMELPPIGSHVMYGRVRYEVVLHGCATGMRTCPHGEHAIAAYQLRRMKIGWVRHLSTLCIDASRVTIVTERG